jgi:hypothetical protein
LLYNPASLLEDQSAASSDYVTADEDKEDKMEIDERCDEVSEEAFDVDAMLIDMPQRSEDSQLAESQSFKMFQFDSLDMSHSHLERRLGQYVVCVFNL